MIFIKNNFKTIQLAVYLTDIDEVSTRVYRFLLPRLLIAHNNRLSSRILMNQELENLYGAYFTTRVEQLGNFSVVSIVLTIVDPKIVEDSSLLDKGLALFKDVLFEHDQFSKSIFDEEKRMLIEQWETLKDNRRLYAQTKFNEYFFETDLAGYPISGSLSDAKKITLDKMTKYYKKVFLNNAVKMVVNGRINDNDITKIEGILDHEKRLEYPFQTIFRDPRPVKTIFEETEMNQAILKIGYHFPIFRADHLYDAAVILDTILGSSPNSRLFQEIREKQGLCYDISLDYDYYKGVIMVTSGVDSINKDLALESIQSLIEDMKKHGITEEELKQAKIYYKHQIKNSMDSQSVLTKRAFIRDLLFYNESIEERLAFIEKITVTDVNETLSKLTLDTIYVLFGG